MFQSCVYIYTSIYKYTSIYIYITFYLVVNYCVDGPMLVVYNQTDICF